MYTQKANLFPTNEILNFEEDTDIVVQPILRAGDCVVFNENTTHGTLPWRSTAERRCVLYRYTPKQLVYVPAYLESRLPAWADDLAEAQRAVLEPPYVYHHPLIEDDGSTVVRPRREGEETAVLSSSTKADE